MALNLAALKVVCAVQTEAYSYYISISGLFPFAWALWSHKLVVK
jgi:hypothetical protein